MRPSPTTDFQTTFRVDRGRTLWSRAVCRCFRLPPAGDAVPLRLTISHRGGREIWVREFGGRRLRTTVRRALEPEGRWRERFGPIEFEFLVSPHERGVEHRQVRCRLRLAGLAIPLPSWGAPKVGGQETRRADGVAQINVQIDAPLFGLLVRYSGTVPEGEHLWSSR